MSHSNEKIDFGPTTLPADHKWRKLPVIGGAVGVIGLGVSLALGMNDWMQFYYSYLVAFMFFLSLGLGGLFFTLVHFATKAGWSVTVRRLAENVMGTLPIFVLLFIPIAIGASDIFHHWTHAPEYDTLVAHKSGYLNLPFFYARAAAYLIIWTVLSLWFLKKSVQQDQTGDHDVTRKLQARAAPGLILFALTLTFAATDWMMTLDPHWYSTIFGVYYFAGAVVAIFATLSLIALGLQRTGLMRNVVTTEHYHDLGKYQFAFVVFWAYIAFSQYMLIWYANIPEETLWIRHRTTNGWENITAVLMVGHFLIPFFFLMPRTVKRIPKLVGLAAIWLLGVHYVDMYWLIMPVNHHHLHLSVMDLTTLIAVGGFFVAALGWQFQRHALLAVKDPRLDESLAFENM